MLCGLLPACVLATPKCEIVAYSGVSFQAPWYATGMDYASNTLGGTGGCKYYLDLSQFVPDDCRDDDRNLRYCGWEKCEGCEGPSMATDAMCMVPGFKAFQPNRIYEEGSKNSQETCEAPSCYPDTWVETEEECTSISYCQGECGYCEDENYWDYEAAASRVLCQIRGQAGESLNETECAIACGGEFTETCFFVKNSVTGTSLCVSPTPEDQSDLSNGCREAIIDEELAGATVSKVKYMPLKCSSIMRADCGWASEQLDTLSCSIQRLQCKTEAECKKLVGAITRPTNGPSSSRGESVRDPTLTSRWTQSLVSSTTATAAATALPTRWKSSPTPPTRKRPASSSVTSP